MLSKCGRNYEGVIAMTKYIVKPSKKFQKDLKKVKSRGYNINLLAEVIQLLAD